MAVAVALTLAMPLAAGRARAAAAEPAAVDSSTVVQLEGDLIVLPDESGVRAESARTASETTSTGTDQILLRTLSGAVVELTGDVVDDAISGSTFDGTVSIPADVAERVEETPPDDATNGEPDDVVDGDSELGATILEATSDLDASLVVVDAAVTPPRFARTATPRAHTLDIAIVTRSSNPTEKVMTDAEVTTMVASLNAYWPSQTAKQVSGVTKPGPVQRITTANACDAMSAWDTGAERFGTTVNEYLSNNDSHHLLVIAPPSCGGGTGLGSVGSLASGGVIWVDALDTVTTHTIAHEFGHNLGLNHSNALLCEGNVSEGPDCFVEEYWDVYDIMGSGLYYVGPNGNVSNRQLMALNVTHKSVLDALPPADLASVTLADGVGYSAATVTLQPASASSGVRGIRVTDPGNGQVYFVEYRSGTGIDDGALYESNIFAGLGVGVRILKLETDGSSTAITRPASSIEERNLFFTAGQSFLSNSGKLTISVSGTGATAAIALSLGTKPVVSVVRYSGADRYLTGVAISKSSFAPKVPVVYVANGVAFPDALAAAPAAAAQGGPLLLTAAHTLPASVREEIIRLEPKEIVVVGGASVVSASVYSQLSTLPITPAPKIRRDAGADRFATSRTIVQNAFPQGSAKAFISTAWNFPDALASSAAAGSIGAPVVLLNGNATSVDAKTRDLLVSLGVEEAVVAGGASVVSTGVESSLRSVPGMKTVTRLGGSDRYATATVINKASFTQSDTVYLANGTGFADALGGAALAGKNKAPLYTVRTDCIPAMVLDEITRLKAQRVVLLGGAGVLTANVARLKACA